MPVHELQKQELARRKANLQKNPASVLGWEDVKQKARSAMAAKVVFVPKAELDFSEAYVWYDLRRPGLGEEF